MHQQIVNVHNYIGEAVDNSFHEALKTGRAPKKSHRASYPLKLTHARYGECSVGAGPGVEDHLPKTGR